MGGQQQKSTFHYIRVEVELSETDISNPDGQMNPKLSAWQETYL